MLEPVNLTSLPIPKRIAAAQTPELFTGARNVEKHFWEFFAATIRNKNTRQAYLTACFRFSDWCALNRITLEDVEPMVVAAYIETLGDHYQPATIKQHLAAIRMLFDYLVLNQVIAMNPASSVRGPKHRVRRGKTPILNVEETRQLLDSIETDTVAGLRDRALIAVMLFSFARISAVVNMTVADYYTQGKRSFFRLTDKGGKYHEVPAHHKAIELLDAYIAAAGIGEQSKLPLFRSTGRGRNRDNAS